MDEKKTKKRKFGECEVEVLVSEVEARKNVLFGSLSSGVTNKRKFVEWQHVAAAVNSVSSTSRTVAEVKKKWSDLKVDAKKRISLHRKSASATGGGKATLSPSPFHERMACLIGEPLLSGVVTEKEGDEPITGEPERTVGVDSSHSAEDCQPGPNGVSGAPVASSGVSSAPDASSGAPRALSGGRVLTEAVLQTQINTITAIDNLTNELKEIKGILSEMSSTLKELVKKYLCVSLQLFIIDASRPRAV
ncbi:myb-related transcription factor, partner of profilin-like [Pygocentrus nattereri]|uniref:myb-related transcription factor, partner of profilin-like n=1 Tax=Pygocentrus nattereri TaxID=42514 RepID=UPI001891C236|nr:myb-related transcription factor, partner of profilin-like [Pygocentrus nattereri]